MANTRVAKLRFLRRDDNSTTSDSDIKLQQGQPFIDMTADPKENPGTLYVGQGEGSLDESGVNVKHSDKSDEAGKFDHEINTFVNLESQSNVFWDGSETVITPGIVGTLSVYNGGTGSTTFNVSNVGEGVLKEAYGGTGRSNGTIAQADTASQLSGTSSFITDLTKEDRVNFSGVGGEYDLGVTGVLPTSHGGTGSSTYTVTGGATSYNTSSYCAIATGLGSTDINNGSYDTSCRSYAHVFCVDKFVVLLMAMTTGIGDDSAMRFKYKDWVEDFNNSHSITIPSFTIVNVQVTARLNSASLPLSGYGYAAGCCVYVDTSNGYLYIGQDIHSANNGWFVTIFGMTS